MRQMIMRFKWIMTIDMVYNLDITWCDNLLSVPRFLGTREKTPDVNEGGAVALCPEDNQLACYISSYNTTYMYVGFIYYR